MHIGLPKTGTSALQVYLAKNREKLLTKSVDYLPTGQFSLGIKGNITSGNGAQLARSLAPSGSALTIANPEAHIQEVFDAIDRSPAETGLLSSEIFSSIPDVCLKQFVDQVEAKGVSVRLVFFVRSQLQSLISGYIQHVKRAACTELPDEFVGRTYLTDKRLQYWSYLQRLQTLFGPDNVICRVYEDSRSTEDGFGVEYLRIIGVDVETMERDIAEINNSLPPSDLAVMLLLNRYSPNTAFCDIVIDNARQVGLAKTGISHHLISTSLAKEISSFFVTENQMLAEKYFGRTRLFTEPEDTGVCNFVSPEELSPKDVASFMAGVVVRLHSRIANIERKLTNRK